MQNLDQVKAEALVHLSTPSQAIALLIGMDRTFAPTTSMQLWAKYVGLSMALKSVFARPIYNEHQDPKNAQLQKKSGFLTRVWRFICNPWVILSIFGMRTPGQRDAQGRPVLNLDQVSLPGVVEHDISLSRRDHLQKEGCEAPQ